MQIISRLRSSLGTLVLFFGFLAIFPFVSSAPALAGTMTLTTYYPAPHGDYANLRLVPMSAPATPCKSGTMYVDSATGFMKFCDNSNGNGTGAWVNIWAAPPVNSNEVATKGYVDAAASHLCYTSYNGSCGFGFNQVLDEGPYGYCRAGFVNNLGVTTSYYAWFLPPAGACAGASAIPFTDGEAYLCCK